MPDINEINGENIHTINHDRLLHLIFEWGKSTNEEMNISETIVEFCDKYNLDEMEVGDILSDNKQFVKLLERDLEKNKIFTGTKEYDTIENDW